MMTGKRNYFHWISSVFALAILFSCSGPLEPIFSETPRFPDQLGSVWVYNDYSDTSGTGRLFELIGQIRREVVVADSFKGKSAVFVESWFTPVPNSGLDATRDTTIFSIEGNNRMIYLESISDLIGDLFPANLEGTFRPGWYPYLMYRTNDEYTIIERDTLRTLIGTDTLFLYVSVSGKVLQEDTLSVNGQVRTVTPLNLSVSLSAKFQDVFVPFAPLIISHWCGDNVGLVQQITGSISIPPEVLGVLIRSPSFRYELIDFRQ
ncbi:MAG: hypothetical protein SFU91_00635 [Chloroherpetonaceae bacterium]|nr:hypothetical protein [Chloroherpetonaceae bacterium]